MTKNATRVTGLLKNIRKFDQYGIMFTGQLTCKENGKTVLTIPIFTHDEALGSILLALAEQQDDRGYTPEVEIFGELGTKFDRRPDIKNEDRKPMMTRIKVETVELV